MLDIQICLNMHKCNVYSTLLFEVHQKGERKGH